MLERGGDDGLGALASTIVDELERALKTLASERADSIETRLDRDRLKREREAGPRPAGGSLH